jgi:type IV pilus assembly protein PilY1
MKPLFNCRRPVQSVLALAFTTAALMGTSAWAQPSSRPLLTNQSGAKPNLMIALDNSGSMAFTYHETYNVTDDLEYEVHVCPSPYSNVNSTNGTAFNSGVGGDAIYNSGSDSYTCYRRYRQWGNWYTQALTNVSVLSNPLREVANWSAQRSADVNPIYYNPRVRYLPRVDGSGNVISPRDPVLPNTVPASERDPSYNVVWISNRFSADFRYTVYQRNAAPNDFRIYHSMYASDGTTRNSQGHVNTLDPSGFTSRYNLQYGLRLPQHIAYTSAPVASDSTTFTYAYCSNVLKDGAGQDIGCDARTSVDVRYGDTTTYTIPTPNTRTDCVANVCTNAQEVANILNWYRWYSNRQLATSTAIGLALADTDANGVPNDPSTFDNQLRIGYMPINQQYNAPLTLPPGAGAPVTLSRGVRMLSRGSTENTQLYSWLNGMVSQGGTPLHFAVDRAAQYYSVGNNVTENPWRTDPTSSSSPEMSCRRSFNLLFSDGGWTSGSPWGPTSAGGDYDNTDGTSFSRTLADGSTETFRYRHNGIDTPEGRPLYTPFPSTGTGGLADLTARYFWHTDMRPSLANGVLDRNGQPTFWQNMATYTVGYLIAPSGEVTGTGLSFNQINQYKTSYTLHGRNPPTVNPTLPVGDLLSSSSQTRVDDFIHAGYSGGARSFSAKTADDVKSIFNIIIAEILNSSGQDAGVSVSSGGDNSTLAGQLKYTVSYRTLDNSGNIQAKELDANGAETGAIRWSAESLLPAPSARRVFTMHGTDQPIDFNGTFGSLTSDVQDALTTGPDAARIPTGTSFIDYLRGDDSAIDANNALYRQRESKIASMVNPPSVLMNYSRDYLYDRVTTGGGVDGWDSYKEYAGRKLGYPSSLFVATNAGTMHSFNASTGVEQAAFMPRRSLRRMLGFARDPYVFEYVLDGPISQNDIFDRQYASAQGLAVADQWRAWRHLGVGSGGRGEPLIYAVNSPINPGSTPNRIPDREDFLWETGPDIINTADGDDVTMGYNANPARSGQTENDQTATDPERGEWIVAINNGHYNGVADGEKAGLVVLNALTGEVIRTIPLPNGFSAGRGLSGVTMLRNYELNHRVVAAYAGDANGQLWRFNLTGDPSTWHVEGNRPLFTVPGNRPIFGAPAWQPHSLRSNSDGFVVVFATGMLLEESDLSDLEPQAIYGIWDRKNTDGSIVGTDPYDEVLPSELLEQRIVSSTAQTVNGTTYYGITDNQIDWNIHKGWYMPMENVHETEATLRAGERSIAEVQNIGNSVMISTTVLRPGSSEEMCTVSDLPANYLYILDARTASASRSRSFDVIDDSRLDNFAVAYLPGGGFSRGVSVSSFFTRPDGTPLSSITVPNPIDPNDPYIDPDVTTRPMGVGADGEYASADSSGAAPCRNMRATIIGTAENPITAGVACPSTGWNRTQFQLSAPPSN